MSERIVNKRYSYISHLMDATSEAVNRSIKVASFWASMGTGALTLNLTVYLAGEWISPTGLLLLSFLMWTALFGVILFTSLSWQSHIMDNVMYGLEPDDQLDNNSPRPTVDITRVYDVQSSTAKLRTQTISASNGVGGKIDKVGDVK